MAETEEASGVTVAERPAYVHPSPLAAIPAKWARPPADMVGKLPKSTKRENPKGKCSECGGWHGLPAVHLDFLGHAELTLALIEIDPDWTWEPAGTDPESGGPLITTQGERFVMWGRLTVLGKTLPGVGTCETDKPEPEKELIGDFLRNAAMRFGIGTSLWSKADRADPAGSDATGGYERRKPATPEPTGPVYRTREEAQIREVIAHLEGEPLKEFQAAFKEQFGEPLSKLDKARHVEALSWTKFTLGVE